MKISIFGATGMAGSAIVAEALNRKHTVIAASRNDENTRTIHGLTRKRLDVSVPGDLDPVLAASDVAVLTVRAAPGSEHLVVGWTAGFLNAAARAKTRVIVIGGAASLRSPNNPDGLVADDPAYTPPEWARVAQASLAQFNACENHPYRGWTYLNPPAQFGPGPRTGRYRRGTTVMLINAAGDSQISATDLAIAVVDEIETPSGEHHFTVAQADPHK